MPSVGPERVKTLFEEAPLPRWTSEEREDINRSSNLIRALSPRYEANLVLMDIEANKGGNMV